MCVVSMVTDFYREKWFDRLPNTMPYNPNYPGGGKGIGTWPPNQTLPPQPPVEPLDVEAIKKIFAPQEPGITQEEIAEFRALLAKAREYDARNNEPACEMRSKQDALIAVAKALGVTITLEQLNG